QLSPAGQPPLTWSQLTVPPHPSLMTPHSACAAAHSWLSGLGMQVGSQTLNVVLHVLPVPHCPQFTWFVGSLGSPQPFHTEPHSLPRQTWGGVARHAMHAFVSGLHSWPCGHEPQSMNLPQLSRTSPHVAPSCLHVRRGGVHVWVATSHTSPV